MKRNSITDKFKKPLLFNLNKQTRYEGKKLNWLILLLACMALVSTKTNSSLFHLFIIYIGNCWPRFTWVDPIFKKLKIQDCNENKKAGAFSYSTNENKRLSFNIPCEAGRRLFFEVEDTSILIVNEISRV